MTSKKGVKNADVETLEQLPVGIILFDSTKIYFLNARAKKIFGITKQTLEKINKLKFYDFVSIEHRARIKSRTKQIIKGKEFDPTELAITNFHGELIDIEAKSNRVYFNNKLVCQSVFLEITKRKESEAILNSSNQVLENLAHYSPDIIYKYDLLPIRSCRFVSDSITHVLGYAPDFFYKASENIKQVILKEDLNVFGRTDKTFSAVHKKLGQGKSTVIRCVHKNKNIVFLEVTINPVYDHKKRLVSVVGTGRDITEKIQTGKLLEETKKRFELIANNSNDVIHFYSYFPKPKYSYVSPNINNLLGYKPEDFYADNNFYTKRLLSPLSDFKKIENDLRNILKKRQKKNYKYTFQTTKANGEPIWLENNLVPIFDNVTGEDFFLNVLRDITEQKKYEEDLKQKSKDYEQLLNSTPTASLIHHQGTIEYCNDAVLKIFQLKNSKNLLGKFLLDFFIEKDRQRALAYISSKRSSTKTNGEALFNIRTDKKQIIDIKLQSKSISYNGKNAVLVVITNLSEQKKLEKQQMRSEVIESTNKLLIKEINERSKVELKLIDQTARLKAIIESSSHLVWTVNRSFEITSFNTNFFNTIRKTFKQHIEVNQKIESFIPTDLKKAYSNYWKPHYKRALAGESIEFEDEVVEDKRKVYRRVYINPIISKNGEINEVVCIASDITEAKIYEQQIVEQSGRTKAIFESGSQIMWSVNRKQELTNFNKNYSQAIFDLHGFYPEVGKVLFKEKSTNDLRSEAWTKRYVEVFKGKSLDFITERETKNNRVIYRQVYLHPIIGNNGEIIEASGIAYDITDKILSEQKIKNQTAKLKAIFESGNQFIWTVDKAFHLTSFNREFSQVIYDIFGFYPTINQNPKEAYPPEKVELFLNFWHSKYEEVIQGKPINFISQRLNSDGNMRYRQIYLNPIYDGNNVIEVAGVGFDITDKILSEQKISNQAAKLNAIFDSSMHYIWTVDIMLRLTSFNKNYFDLIKNIYDTQPYLGFQLNRGILADDKKYIDLIEKKYKEAFTGVPKNFELELADKFGSRVFLEVFLNPIFDGSAVVEVSGIAHDITEKKTSQERIVQSLREKEILLKEVHHRVKNNMQVISSILNLQSSYVSDEYALGLLKESQNRIKTMAYIHESLYQNKTFATIDFSDYIATLSGNIIQSYAVSSDRIELILNIERVMLNLDVSIPAGLIINEVVTNSMKHAFSGGKSGFLAINLKSQNNVVILTIADNGKGLPDNFDHKNINSLGLQLVNTLTEQIDGTVEFKQRDGGGTLVNITFPIG
jgi:PAS domain S-box-containing protein